MTASDLVRRLLPRPDRNQTAPDTPTTRDDMYPFVAFPVIDGVSVATPSENTMSDASDTRDRLETLCSYPLVAYTASHASCGSAICDVASLLLPLVAASTLGYTSKCTWGQRPE